MKFATIGHLDHKERLKQIPPDWIKNDLIISPKIDFQKTEGYFLALKLTAEQMTNLPLEKVRQKILDAALYSQNKLDVELLQLGAFNTSVTSGGTWLTKQTQYKGFVNHGDSYTATITCQNIMEVLKKKQIESQKTKIAIVGAYGIIGEATSKILVPKFSEAILIGRRQGKLKDLEGKISGNFTTTTNLEETKKADVILTATNHPTALLKTDHLKEKAIVVDVSQPPNLSLSLCNTRQDVTRVDGGYVDIPEKYQIQIPGMPKGKLFACIVEVIMQAMENEKQNHVGTIDLNHLQKTEMWAEKYNFKLKELTNFGKPITI